MSSRSDGSCTTLLAVLDLRTTGDCRQRNFTIDCIPPCRYRLRTGHPTSGQ